MRLFLTAFVLAASTGLSQAEPSELSFVSTGVSISYGSRGLAFGAEISGGVPFIEEPIYAGTAIGFDIAPWSETWGRLYLEVEGGALIAGAGIGPAWLFGGPEPGHHLQFTPYLSGGGFACEDVEPFLIVAPYYRYTSQRERRGLHEAGTFVKGLMFPNGRRDRGVCIH